VMMSGGLDSTSVAAVAQESSQRRNRPCALTAHTMTYHHLTGSREGHFAQIAGQAIGVPVEVFDGSAFHPFAACDSADGLQPEPCDLTFAAANRSFMLGIQRTGARVVLTGQGGDPLFATSKDYFWNLLRSLQVPSMASYLASHMWRYHRPPPILIRSRLKRFLAPPQDNPFPDWVEPSFAERWDLPARWERAQVQPASIHPTRPEAYAGLAPAFWQRYLRRADAAMANHGLETRHPFFDVRLVEYLLAIPPSPWFLEKSILREAMQDKLPEEIRLRRKTPAAGHPIQGYLARCPGPILRDCSFLDGLGRFVKPQAAREIAMGAGSCKAGGTGLNLRSLSLGVWLHHSQAAMADAERKALR
jgi:asparagine synthase (glutamine-hydrolysing)